VSEGKAVEAATNARNRRKSFIIFNGRVDRRADEKKKEKTEEKEKGKAGEERKRGGKKRKQSGLNISGPPAPPRAG